MNKTQKDINKKRATEAQIIRLCDDLSKRSSYLNQCFQKKNSKDKQCQIAKKRYLTIIKDIEDLLENLKTITAKQELYSGQKKEKT